MGFISYIVHETACSLTEFFNMFKTIFSVVATSLLLAALFFSGTFQTKASALDDAITYLQTKDNSPWITMAQVAAGQSPDVSYLNSFTADSTIGISAPILALSAAGGDASSLVTELKTYFDGTQIGDSSTLNDDIFGLLALLSAGETNETVKSYIIANQNEDGGWPFVIGGGSDTNMTSMGIMVLVEAGVLSSDAVIQNALSYLRLAQNEDGGFPYDPNSPYGTDSDSSSDSWVISALYKTGEDPTTWTKGVNTPITHLLSLQTPEGWFNDGWGENSFTPLSTSYAVIALSGKSYPVEGSVVVQSLTVEASFRIEGSLNQVCSGTVQAVTALDVVKNAASQCGYAYNIDDTDFGPYLTTIVGDVAEGFIGWIYFVNKESALVGAADYELLEGDEVLWYYGDFTWPPLDISIEKEVYLIGETLTGSVQSYSSDIIEGASVVFNGETVVSDASGVFQISLLESGSFEIRAEKTDYVRSQILVVTVVETVQEIALSVEIIDGGGAPQIPEVGFSVSTSNIPFGTVGPGGTVSSKVTITNEGIKNLLVKASVTGDEAFYFLKLDNILWSLFETLLLSQSQQEIDLNLSFPSEFSSFGQKQGSLIFWGVPQL